MTEGTALSPADREAVLTGYRAIRDVLQGATTPVRVDDGLERLTRLATALASLAATEMVTAARLLRDLDEDEARAAAVADLENRITDIELAVFDGGQIPPVAPLPEDG